MALAFCRPHSFPSQNQQSNTVNLLSREALSIAGAKEHGQLGLEAWQTEVGSGERWGLGFRV